MKMPKNIQEDKSEKLGFFARRKRAIDHYVAVRKERSKEVRDYLLPKESLIPND